MMRGHPFLWAAKVTGVIIVSILLGITLMQFMVVSTMYRDRYITITNNNNMDSALYSDMYTTVQEMFRRSLFSPHDDRIVGGVPVEDGEFPFFVHPIGMLLCGATLIHPEYVHKFIESFTPLTFHLRH